MTFIDFPLAEAILQIDSLPSSALLATDGDGTLWTQDIGEAFFEWAVSHRLVGEGAAEVLRRELLAHALAVPESPSAQARALLSGYLSGNYPEDRMCAVMAFCVAGRSLREVQEASEDALDVFDLDSHAIQESQTLLVHAAKRGMTLVVVSASPTPIVEAATHRISKALGIAKLEVLAMTPAVQNGLIQPEIDGIWTYGEGKLRAIEKAFPGRQIAVAMGDNTFDGAMLKASQLPIAVRPKPGLIELSPQIPGLRRLLPEAIKPKAKKLTSAE